MILVLIRIMEILLRFTEEASTFEVLFHSFLFAPITNIKLNHFCFELPHGMAFNVVFVHKNFKRM